MYFDKGKNVAVGQDGYIWGKYVKLGQMEESLCIKNMPRYLFYVIW